MREKTRQSSIRLAETSLREAETIAAATGASRSATIKRACQLGLEQLARQLHLGGEGR